MKNSSFTGLLFREYYIVRSSYISALITFLACAVLGFLMMLSFRFGNLGLLIGDMSGQGGGIIKNEAIAVLLRFYGIIGMKYIPPFMTYVFVVSTANAAAKDNFTSWNRFEHCMPVSPLRFAAVKTAATAIVMAVSLILALGYLYAIHLASGEVFSLRDMSAVIAFQTFGILMSILAQIFIKLLRNRDMGFLCSMAAFLIPGLIFAMRNGAAEEESPDTVVDTTEVISRLIDKTTELLPFMLIIIAVSFAALFISMYLLYKRREK